MKKSVWVMMLLTLGAQWAMAESLVCRTADQKVQIELQSVGAEVIGVRVSGLDSTGADIMVADTEKTASSLKVTMIDLTNAKGLELSVEAKDQKMSGVLLDMGAAGNASTEYAVTCEVK
ncbi:hypothetical protein EZJ49_03065 [Bdellovibrio bacteriovorus]|uniref:hypothetical protein n=1 Tax=Bdellovibrio bacteriovorus TaxID=959 RepID=UPI0021D08F43|nr:hypothetical protein [Bdellovibrio bacteriovorus]UXR65229.1 hypothetical protein EZJ49_03065 [Bdellovibrio bacteriovorus]